ncbi:MAG: XRE family transcriptional regulator [Flavobacteriales bacterium]|nr:MAG: XRE family transcriptional regulator [Flavobacteriales bacterium]
MINNELIVSRIKKLMDENKLTSSSFAKKIKSTRANVSHILSGRNKPSLNFLIKIVNSFDGISLDWFVNEKFKHSEEYEESFNLKKNNKEDDTRKIKSIVHFYENGTFRLFKNSN